jgi:hypothetical protein
MSSTSDEYVEGAHPLKLLRGNGIFRAMTHQPMYRVNSDQVSHENIDGETMVINFDTGVYYNIRLSSLTVWNALEQGATFDELIAEVSRAHVGEDLEIRAGVRSFLDELIRENLIVETGNDGAARPRGAAPPAAERVPFTPPTLEKYTDMQDFLLADPVHDTDEAGFPKPRAERPDTR